MEQGSFCFLSKQYFIDFPDDKLMKNKEVLDGVKVNRPCFFAFEDEFNKNIYWLVPISSRCEKFKLIYDKKVKKHGECDTLCFGKVIDRDAVFLIQNICIFS